MVEALAQLPRGQRPSAQLLEWRDALPHDLQHALGAVGERADEPRSLEQRAPRPNRDREDAELAPVPIALREQGVVRLLNRVAFHGRECATGRSRGLTSSGTLVDIAVLPPGPKSRLPGGLVIAMRRDPIGFLTRVARESGDIAYFRLGRQRVFLLANPDEIRELLVVHKDFIKGRGVDRARHLLGRGLLTSNGELHLRQRRLVQPAFRHERIASYADVIVEYGARARSRWRDGETLDAAREMTRLTLQTAARTLLDADVESEVEEIGEDMATVMRLFSLATPPLVEHAEALRLPSVLRYRRARARLDRRIYRLIGERRASREDRSDLLSLLLSAQDEEGDGGGMSDRQLRDEVLTLLAAGHETVANALTWTWHLLSQHPHVEARLHAEVDSALAGRLPAFEDVERLPYTNMALEESMRLYPPSWFVGRRSTRAVELAGYPIPVNSLLLTSQYVVHRDPRFYPEPERFDPERWTPEAQAARPKLSYYPFGAGPRRCIGERFAWMEAVLLIATIAQEWRLRPVPGHAIELEPLASLRPRHGLPMRLERRRRSPAAVSAFHRPFHVDGSSC